jgi:hypothetical protein
LFIPGIGFKAGRPDGLRKKLRSPENDDKKKKIFFHVNVSPI